MRRDNIEDTLISLLNELKQKKIHVLDIKVDCGTPGTAFYRNGKEGSLNERPFIWRGITVEA